MTLRGEPEVWSPPAPARTSRWIAPDAEGVPGAVHVRLGDPGSHRARCLNSTAVRMLGPAAAGAEFDLADACPAAASVVPLVEDALHDGDLRATELDWGGSGGADRVRCVVTPTEDGALVLLEDVTDRHRATDALEAAERRLAQVQDWRGGGFWELDMHTGHLYWSTQAFEVLRLHSDSLDALLERVHPDDRPLIEHVTSRARAQPGPYRATHRTEQGGEVRVMQHTMQSVLGADGTPQRLLGFVTDVTAEHAIEEQLRRASSQQSIALLAGGLVHDLNNAFAIVHGHAQLGLQAHERGDAIDRLHLEAIERAAVNAKELTRSLLSIGREEPLAPTRFSPVELLERVAAMARATLGSQRSVALQLDAHDVDVVADPGRVERVMVDLVINARDALRDGGGSVTIGLDRIVLDGRHELVIEGALAPGLYAELSVIDDGSGIDEETLDRIVEPFFSTKPAERGSGIGLASANAFAERSGGHLAIESELGHGTTVRVLLPAIDASTHRPAGDRPQARRVLVASRDPESRSRLDAVVAAAGFQVVRATSLWEAVTVLRTEPIDLVATDAVVGEPLEASPVWREQHRGRTGLLLLAPGGWDPPSDSSAMVLPTSADDEVVTETLRDLLQTV